jgi:hypothetical protein
VAKICEVRAIYEPPGIQAVILMGHALNRSEHIFDFLNVLRAIGLLESDQVWYQVMRTWRKVHYGLR